jgi:hypothetical protein
MRVQWLFHFLPSMALIVLTKQGIQGGQQEILMLHIPKTRVLKHCPPQPRGWGKKMPTGGIDRGGPNKTKSHYSLVKGEIKK